MSLSTGSSWWRPFWEEQAALADPLEAVGRSTGGTQLADFDALAQDAVEALRPMPTDSMLDIGCANGLLSSRLAPLVGKYIVCDYAEPMVRVTRQQIPAACVASIAALPFTTASFDKVLAASVMHYLDEDEIQSALREMRRVLKPGGRAMLSGLPNMEAAFGMLIGTAFGSHTAEHKVWMFTNNFVRSGWFWPKSFCDAMPGFGFKGTALPIHPDVHQNSYQFDILLEVAS